MIYDILNIVLLIPLLYYAWKQQQEIEGLKLVIGAIIMEMEEEDDVLFDQQT